MPRILVTYASRYGSTREVATAIASELTAAGFDVDTLHAGPEVKLDRYDAVVIGSPTYGRKWLPDSSVFVVANRERLSQLPTAMFTVGTLGVKNPKSALREHSAIMETLGELAPSVEPVSTALFHGSFSRSNLPLFLRIVDWFAATPQGDHRDWAAITAWGRKLASAFSERFERTN